MSYTWEKLYSAVHTLSTSKGEPRERLIDAYNDDISALEIVYPSEIPEQIRDKVQALVQITSGDVESYVNKLDEADVLNNIEEIIGLYSEATRLDS